LALSKKFSIAIALPKLYTFGNGVKVMIDASPIESIRKRIKKSDIGTIFIPSDFSDLTDYSNIKVSLSRLIESGLIRRVIRGVYEYPEYNDFIKDFVSSNPHKVALAISRNHSWTIVPDGDTALNQLGLSTQVPAEWTYVSDGPYKKYTINKTVIRFKHTANKDISKLTYKSALLVQAIKALGKGNITGTNIQKISKLMTDEEKVNILEEGRYMTTWVFDIIKEICMGDSIV